MGTFLPRQLISEKKKSATEKIPDGFGGSWKWDLLTTVVRGNFINYILDVEPEYQGPVFRRRLLRTLTRLVVKDNLFLDTRVVEVNTWGWFFFKTIWKSLINTEKTKRDATLPHKRYFQHIEKKQLPLLVRRLY